VTKLAANLSFMFQEAAFSDRFAAAGQCGFRGVEFLFPYAWPAADVAGAAADAGVDVVLFNLPPGDWDAGDRGLAALPDRRDEFRRSLDVAFEYAAALKTPTLHVMAGVITPDVRLDEATAVYLDNLRYAAAQAPTGVTLTVEPINHRDMPGYFLRTSTQALAVLQDLALDNVRLQFDLYHAQISEGDLTRRVERLVPWIAHVQIAGVPDRHEPGDGEVNFPYLLKRLDDLGYGGWVGCEYRPKTDTRAGLGWAAAYGVHP
jgi:2-dehydrotetronate isomerase